VSQDVQAITEKLTKLFFDRDERAIKETQNEYGDYCLSVAYNIIGNRLDAEECVNDAYLRVWNSIPPARPINFKAFIAKITRNLAIDKIKHRTAKKRDVATVAFEELEGTLAAEELFISDGVGMEELQKAINKFLYTQSPRDRAIFILRYFYCESVSIVAKKMCTSESNTSKILKKTREELKEYLKKEGYYV
jgi:RNA polymerase sigma-70 factor (ECF subfamily)